MPLLPSLKEKKRYVAFEVVSKEKFNFNHVKKTVDEALFKYIGLLGTSKAGMQLLPEKYQNNRGLIRINHKFTNHIKAAFTLIDKINNKKAVVRSLGTSGILKKAVNKYLRGE
jgi:ribonuclease P/MRP protein subunit POP5